MSTKYTPAPWAVVDNGLWDISIKAGGTVCHINSKGDWFPSGKDTLVGRSQNKMLADARLIAAAPELLEALREMVTSYQYEASSDNLSLLKAKVAIAKALGETNGD